MLLYIGREEFAGIRSRSWQSQCGAIKGGKIMKEGGVRETFRGKRGEFVVLGKGERSAESSQR